MVAKNFFQSSMFSDKSLSYSPLLVSHGYPVGARAGL